MERIAVVGASLAGLRAAEALRREGHTGRLTLIGAERHLPYDRPPLSKELLTGEWDHDRVVLRKQPYDELELELLLGARATALDLAERAVRLHDGSVVPFDGLVIATGASPRRLPGLADLEGVRALRTLEDAAALRADLDARARLCIIGAGFIGSEVAAAARARGLEVTVLEALAQPMVRGVGERIGAALASLQRAHGVDLRTGVSIERLDGTVRVERVVLGDGTAVDCDTVLVAVGAAPETAWLEGSGLVLDDGVCCDETLLAAPGVVAAGDVARWPNPLFDGEVMRLEHWTNAAEQAVAAARRLLADDAAASPFAPVPFVWSDQFGVKIQSAGRFGPADRMEVVHGEPEAHRFVAVFERGGRISGVLGCSEPRLVMQYRRLIAERTPFAQALTALA